MYKPPIKLTKRQLKDQEDMNKIEIVAEIHEPHMSLPNQNNNAITKPSDTRGDANKNSSNNNEKNVCWFYVNRKCKFGQKCRNQHPETCKSILEYGRCNDRNCKLVHPYVCRNFQTQGGCQRYNCWFIHPSKIVITNQGRSMPHGPQGFRQRVNNMGSNQYNEPRSNQISNVTDFLGNWPTPAEAL